MISANLSIRTDKETKDRANQIFNELGLNMTTAINIFLKTTIRENGLPFDLKLVPNAETIEAIKETEKILKDNNRKRYESIEELREALEV